MNNQQNFKSTVNNFLSQYQSIDFGSADTYKGFRTVKPIGDVKRGFELINLFYNSSMEDHVYSSIYNILQNFYSALREIISYGDQLSTVNEATLRTTISQNINQLESYYNQYRNQIKESDAYTPISNTEIITNRIAAVESVVNGIHSSISKLSNEKPEVLAEQLKKHKIILDEIDKQNIDFKKRFQEVMPQMQSISSMNFFQLSAEKQRQTAIIWLVYAFVSVCACAYLIFTFYIHPAKFFQDEFSLMKNCKECVLREMNFRFILQLTIRIASVTLCLYVTSICIRNYRSAMHNKSTNLQKANSFNALLALNQNLSESKELLSLGIYAIFKEALTGYEDKDNKVGDDLPFSRLIEKVSETKIGLTPKI